MAVQPEWVYATPDAETVDRLASALQSPEPVASVLASRGYADPDSAERFLDSTPADVHPPSELRDLQAAVERLERALDDGETIAVFADKDVDGATGAAIFVRTLRELEARVTARLPGKWDGYGLDGETVDEFAATGADLLVTVDCGTTAHGAIEHAREVDLDVVVTDHHDPPGDLPDATAVVNPRRADCEYSNPSLAGGAVAFKLGQALVEARTPTRIERYHRDALPLAAVATVGDYVPLTQENRALVREGFDRLFDARLAGLVETARHAGVESTTDLSWSLVPLLNAGTEDPDGELLLDLLCETDPDRYADHIDRLEAYREQRREDRAEQLAHLRECLASQCDPEAEDVLVIEVDEYVGGVAKSRLVDEYGRPVFALRQIDDDRYRCDGRTAADVDLLALLDDCEDLLAESWGHPGAAGFVVAAEDRGAVRECLQAAAAERYDESDLRPTVEIEARLEPDHLADGLHEGLSRLGPFGPDNAEPEFLLEGLQVESCEVFGDGHCKLHPAETDAFVVLAWDDAEPFEEYDLPAVFDLVGTVGYDSYTDVPALTLTDHRPVEE